MHSPSSLLKLHNLAIVCVASVAIGVVICNGQEISRADLLPSCTDCSHVIELIHRHGVNRNCDHADDPQFIHHSPFGSMLIPMNEMGDLQIIDVHRMESIDVACGPKIAVTVSNQSTRCVKCFSITAVATFGAIHPACPSTTVRVQEMQPGETRQVELTLPIESLAMGNLHGQVVGFQKLVVVIDSFDEWIETDEANNIKAYAAASLPVLQPAIETTSASVDEVTSEATIPTRTDNSAASVDSTSTQAAPAVQAENTSENADPLKTAWQQLNDPVDQSSDDSEIPESEG